MNTNDNTNTASANAPSLCFYHANALGTGAALRLRLRPASGGAEGYIALSLAPQREGGSRLYPRFAWEEAVEAKLGLVEVAEVLEVIRGYQESIADGKGIFQRTAERASVFHVKHMIEPHSGYVFEGHAKSVADGAETSAKIVLSVVEAMGLSAAVEQALLYVSFGVPPFAVLGEE